MHMGCDERFVRIYFSRAPCRGGYFVTIAGALPQKPRADIRSSTFINSATNLQNFQLLGRRLSWFMSPAAQGFLIG